jgi:hypothetical protein
VSFIAKNPHLIESKDRESSVIQTGSILNSILGAHCLLFVTSAHSRQAGSSKDRQPGLPGIGVEPGNLFYSTTPLAAPTAEHSHTYRRVSIFRQNGHHGSIGVSQKLHVRGGF